jgi:hypothetical protein
MRNVLASELGEQLYKERKQTIEPVFGHTKHNRRFGRFSPTRPQRRVYRVAVNDDDPQPHQAPQPPDGRHRGLRRPHRRLRPPDGRCPATPPATTAPPPPAPTSFARQRHAIARAEQIRVAACQARVSLVAASVRPVIGLSLLRPLCAHQQSADRDHRFLVPRARSLQSRRLQLRHRSGLLSGAKPRRALALSRVAADPDGRSHALG